MSRLTGLQIGDYIGVILTRLTLTDAPVYVSACQTKLVLVFGGLHKGSGIFVQGKKKCKQNSCALLGDNLDCRSSNESLGSPSAVTVYRCACTKVAETKTEK